MKKTEQTCLDLRQRALEKLANPVKSFEPALFQVDHTIMLLIDPATGAIMDANPAAIKFYGWTHNEICSKNISEINNLEPERLPEELYLAKIDKRRQFLRKHRLANGEVRVVEVFSGPVHFGDIEFIYSVIHDITQRKTLEEKLHKSEEKYSKAFQTSPYSILISRLVDGKLIEINDKFIETTGYSRQEALDQTTSSLNLWADLADRTRLIGELYEKGKVSEVESTFKRKNGELFPGVFSATLIRLFDEDHIFAIIRDITDIRTTKELLKKNEERFSTLVENINDVIFEVDGNGTIKYISPSIYNILGFKSEELTGKNFTSLAVGKDQELSMRFQLLSQMKELTNEYQFTGKSGVKGWIRLSSVGIFEDGRLTGAFGTLIDISGQKSLEENLRQSSQKWETIVSTSPDGIGMATLDGKNLFLSDKLARMYGYSTDEKELFIGSSIFDFIDPSNHLILKENLAKLLEGEYNHGIREYIAVKNNGSRFYVEIHSAVVCDKDGKPESILYFERDISDRKLAEEEIRNLNANLEHRIAERTAQLFETNAVLEKELARQKQSEETLKQLTTRLSLAVHAGGVGVWEYEIEKNILTWDDRMFSLYGISRENFAGAYEAWQNGLHPEDKERCDAEIQMAISGEKDFNTIFRVIFPNGDQRIVQAHAIVNRDDSGKAIKMIGTNMDITVQVQHEKELNLAKTIAEEANLAKSEFLSRMSHELRTPMNSILGFAQLMEMGDLAPNYKKGVRHILNSGKHLLNLINEVLDIFRIEAGHLTLSIESVQIITLIKQMIDTFQPLAASKKVNMSLLNLSGPEILAKADQQRLKQVLLNLIDNAIKYNFVGGNVVVKTELTALKESKARMIRISVTDDGPGISPENKGKVFLPFERLGAEHTNNIGTGLGLAVVKKLIEAMNGEIGIESNPGAGTTFWIELAVIDTESGSSAGGQGLEDINPRIFPTAGTILYIEDNKSNIELVEQILVSKCPNIRLISSTRGEETVSLAIKHAPDLILLDLNLPDIYGGIVLKKLLSGPETKQIPVVVLSADATTLQYNEMMRSGAENYITKPLDVNAFLMMINEILTRKISWINKFTWNQNN